MCMTSFTPPFSELQIRYAHPISPGCHQLYSNCSEAVRLATRTLLLAAFLRSVVIFVKYREVPTRTILPNFVNLSAETALYSRFGGQNGGIVRGEKRKRHLQFGQPRRFSRATKKVLACSHSRSLQLLQWCSRLG